MNDKKKTALPLGFGMALSQNEEALRRFSALSSSEREAIMAKAKRVSSKEEMQALVDSIAPNDPTGLLM